MGNNKILIPPKPLLDREVLGVELLVMENALRDKLTRWGAGEEFGTYPRPIHTISRFLVRHLGECLSIWEMENRIKKNTLPFEARYLSQVGRVVWMKDDLLRAFLSALYREGADEREKILTWIFEKRQENERGKNKTIAPEKFKKIQEREKNTVLPALIKIINKEERAKNWLGRVPLSLPEERETVGELMGLLGIDEIFQVCHPN